jgi:hypothetical protein
MEKGNECMRSAIRLLCSHTTRPAASMALSPLCFVNPCHRGIHSERGSGQGPRRLLACRLYLAPRLHTSVPLAKLCLGIVKD